MFFKKAKGVIRGDWFASVPESKEEIVQKDDGSYFYPFSSKKYNEVFNQHSLGLKHSGGYSISGYIIDADYKNGTLKFLNASIYYSPFDVREVVKNAYRCCYPAVYLPSYYKVITVSLIGSGLSSEELPVGKRITCICEKKYDDTLYVVPPSKYVTFYLLKEMIKHDKDVDGHFYKPFFDFKNMEYHESEICPYNISFDFEVSIEQLAKEEYDICQEIKALKEKEPMASVYTDEFLRYYIKKMKHRINGFYLRSAIGADLEEDAIFSPVLFLNKYYDKVITICTDLWVARFSELYDKVDGEHIDLKSIDDIVLPTKELTEYYIWETNEDDYNKEMVVTLLRQLIQMFKDNPKERYCLIFDNTSRFLPTLFTDDFDLDAVDEKRTYEHEFFDFFFADNRPKSNQCITKEDGIMPFANVTWNCFLNESLPKDKPYFRLNNYYYGFSVTTKPFAKLLYDEFFRFATDNDLYSKIWKSKDTFIECSLMKNKDTDMENLLTFVGFFIEEDVYKNLYFMPEYRKVESYDKFEGREKDKIKNDFYNLFHGSIPPTFEENRKALGYKK